MTEETSVSSAILKSFFYELRKIERNELHKSKCLPGQYCRDYFPYMPPIELPPPAKTLTTYIIDKKIERIMSHIAYLERSISCRNTHGGKAFRALNISIKEQISSASERLDFLQLERTALIKQEIHKAHTFILSFVEKYNAQPQQSKLTAMLYNAGIKTSPPQHLTQQLSCPVSSSNKSTKSKVRKTVRFEGC